MAIRSLLLAALIGLPGFAQELPRIEWADLPEIVDPAPDLRTGWLVVPENRHDPKSKAIRLPFVVEKSRNPNAPKDPILFTAGGPGGSTLWAAKRRAHQPLLDDRDLILLEQRGTHYARPSLEAPEVDAALRSGWGTRLDGRPDPAVMKQALGEARARFEVEGVDLSGYTTEESAADIADLQRLLALPALNLYGVSYSTKLMLTVLRDHSEGIRSVLLDSVLTPESNWDEEAPANILEVLDRAIAAGAKDPKLATACAGLKARFLKLAARTNRHPLTITIKNPQDGSPLKVRLDGSGLMSAVYAGLETAGSIRPTLAAMDGACKGDPQTMAPMVAMDLGSSQGAAWGMRLSIWCNEELPFERLPRILHPAGVPKALRGWFQAAVPLEALEGWHQGHPDPKENTPISSAVPILIASGEFDPDTPGAWARAAMARWPNAHLVFFPGMSHAPLFTHPDGGRLMKAFFDDPNRTPEVGKITEVPDFLLSGSAH